VDHTHGEETMENKTNLDLFTSLNTETVDSTIVEYGKPAPSLANNGIERDGGITNLYSSEVVINTDTIDFTDDDKKITTEIVGDNRWIYINDKKIGEVSALGIESKVEIEGALDVTLDDAGNYITLTYASEAITLKWYTSAGEFKEEKIILFPGIPDNVTGVYFVRQQDMEWNTPFEFILRTGNKASLLREAGEYKITVIRSSTFIDSIIWDDKLIISNEDGIGYFDGSDWYWPTPGDTLNKSDYGLRQSTLAIYDNYLVVINSDKGISSWDGYEWKLYNGSGTHDGPYIDVNDIPSWSYTDELTSGCQYKSELAIGMSLGVMSWDGYEWTFQDGTGGSSEVFSSYITDVTIVMSYYDERVHNSFLITISGAGKDQLSSFGYFGSGWRYSDGTGSGAGPYAQNPGGLYTVYSVIQHNLYLVLGGQ